VTLEEIYLHTLGTAGGTPSASLWRHPNAHPSAAFHGPSSCAISAWRSAIRLAFIFRTAHRADQCRDLLFPILGVWRCRSALSERATAATISQFVIIGVAFSEYLAIGISAIGDSIREGQTTGTLELMLLSPTRLGGGAALIIDLGPTCLRPCGVTLYLIVGAALGMRFEKCQPYPLRCCRSALAIFSFRHARAVHRQA